MSSLPKTLATERQAEIVSRIARALSENGLQCSMVTTETFYHAVWAGGPAAEAPEVREYAKFRVRNTVEIGHELGARFAVYWPGSLGYYVQGAIDEIDTLRWYADALNAACERDIECARERKRDTLKHCLEAKPFEPQAEILLPTSDAMLAFIGSGLLKHPEMVGLNPEYLHELMWGGAPRAALAPGAARGQTVPLRYQRRLPAEARCRYRRGPGESARLAERTGAAAQPRIQRTVQSRLQAATHYQHQRRLRSQLPHRCGPVHHVVGDGGRGDRGPDHQGSHRRVEARRRRADPATPRASRLPIESC